MNQYDRILQYLDTHPEGITPMDAFNHLRITKLATRISELIRRGYQISKTTETHKAPDGTQVRYKRYKKAV
jgi:hypothetical protein